MTQKSASPEVFVLGGYQTDFARNWTKEQKHFSALMREAVTGAMQAADIPAEDILHAGPSWGFLHRG